MRGQPGQPVVDARELDGPVVQLALGNLAGAEVDRPTPQHAVGFEATGAPPQLGIANGLQHNRIAVVVGVGDVEYVARIDVEPAHLTERVVPSEHAEPGTVVVVPAVGHIALAGHRDVEIKTTGGSMKTTCPDGPGNAWGGHCLP